MDTYAERLTWAIKNAGITQTKLAKLAETSPQTVQYLCDKKNNAQGSKHNSRFAEALGISPIWLETGEGEKFIVDSNDQLLEMLGIDTKNLDVDQIDIIKYAMKVKKENRPHLKKVIGTYIDDAEPEDKKSNK